jgi:FMN phosphatase YigB (HAD superfamily)
VHVGDTPDADAAGALAAGLRAVLVARHGPAGGRGSTGEAGEAGVAERTGSRAPLTAPPGVPVIRSLAELPALCAYSLVTR